MQERLPIWIGGGGEKVTLRICAEHADGWNVPFIPPDVWAHKAKVLDEHCERIGRDPASITKSVNVGMAFTDEELRAQFGAMANYVKPGVLSGSVQEMVDKVSGYVDAGAEWVILAMRAPFDRDGLERFAAEVLPAVRGLTEQRRELFRWVVAAFMDGPMVTATSEFAVREARLATVRPMHTVVRVAPFRRPVTSGGDAATVSHDERTPERSRDDACRAADVERLRETQGDDAGDSCVARDAAQCFGRQPADVRGVGVHSPRQIDTAPTLEYLDVRDHVHLRSSRPQGAVGKVCHAHSAQIDERVGAALRGGSVLGDCGRVHRCVQRGQHHLSRLLVEQAVDRNHSVEQV